MIALATALAALLLSGPTASALPPAAAPPADPSAARYAAALQALDRDHGPAALLALHELQDVVDEQPERAQALLALGRLADDPAGEPELRALARQRQAGQELARGSLQRAEAILGRLGFVTHWLVVGPFDDEGKKGLETAYPPERALDLAARMPGKVREVAWRAAPPEAMRRGYLRLEALLRPASEVVAYALAVVDSPRAQPARLWLGGSGRAKVWVNGALALTDPGDHPARLDQRGALVALQAGPNRILVKLCQGTEERMAFALRLAGEAGEGLPLQARDPAALLAAGLPPAPRPGERPRPLVTLVERLDVAARAAAGRPGPQGREAEAAARQLLALALDLRQAADAKARRPAREARRAAELRPGDPALQLLAASLEEERNPRLGLIQAALAVAPEHPRALAALAQERLSQDRPHEAVRLLTRAVAAAPGWAAARAELATARERAGQGAAATAERLALAERTPPTRPGVLAAAGAARREGDLDRAAGLLRAALALRHDDASTRASLARLLIARGDLDGALALHAEALRLDPSDVQGRLATADLLAANGRAEAAEAAYADALRLCPEEADAWERRGRARLRAGRTADALADLQRAQELRPQDTAVKELVRSLEPAREKFEAPYLADAAALAAAAGPASPQDDAVVLSDLEVVRLHRSGLASRYRQLVLKVLTQRGADAARRQSIGYDPGRQEVKVERGRLLKADGAAVEAWEESDQSASEPWYRLYYDTRTRTLTFPALAPGDVLEVAWRLDDTAAENLLSDYFGDLSFVAGAEPRRRFDYVLLAPADRPIHANAPAGLTRGRRELPGGLVEHRWQARDVARVQPEPRMPGWAEVVPALHVSTYAAWEEVDRFYWGLVRDQLAVTPEISALARRLAEEALAARGQDRRLATKGLAAADPATQRAVVAALYGFVVTQTRYVGLEFGIHGYKPYRVDQVLERRFGDCKDKASLTHALLEAVGLDSKLVLLRMRRLGRVAELPASLAVFNHAILWVPSLDLWLDGTASYTGTRELPGEDRGASVLVVEPSGPPRFGRIPDATPEENLMESRFDLSLGADGAARVEGATRVAGVQAPGYRRAYQSESGRTSTLETAFSRNFPGLAVTRVGLSDLERLEEDVRLDFTLQVPRWAERDGGGLRFSPFGRGAGYAETWASLAERRHDLVLGSPSVNRFRYRVALPPGWQAGPLPEPAAGETAQAAFSVAWRRDGDAVVAEGFVTFKAPLVPAAAYPAFRELMVRIDRAFGRTVTAAPPASPERP